MTANAQERSASPRTFGAPLDGIDGSLRVPSTTRYADDYQATGIRVRNLLDEARQACALSPALIIRNWSWSWS
jgi:hypothetical protein